MLFSLAVFMYTYCVISYKIFFADDAKLYIKIVNSVDTAVLQAALNALCGPLSGNSLLLLISAVFCMLETLIRRYCLLD